MYQGLSGAQADAIFPSGVWSLLSFMWSLELLVRQTFLSDQQQKSSQYCDQGKWSTPYKWLCVLDVKEAGGDRPG